MDKPVRRARKGAVVLILPAVLGEERARLPGCFVTTGSGTPPMAIALNCALPARFDKAVVLACDGNYFRYALFAAAQIADLAPGRDFDICVCVTEAATLPPSLGDRGLRVGRLETGGAVGAVRPGSRQSAATFLRLVLPGVLAGDYRQLLYMDCDVFVQGGDFSSLFNAGPGDRPVAAVRDNSQWRTPLRKIDSYRRLRLPAAPYFNAGVLLIDVDAYNRGGVYDACNAVAAKYDPADLLHMDQDLLNIALQGRWAELSPVWNWQYTWASRFFEAMAGAHVVHFIGPKKPWTHTGGELPLKFRRAYRAFFAAHFPDDPPLGPDGPDPGRNRAFLRKSLAKHLIATGAMCTYLERFENDLTVIP